MIKNVKKDCVVGRLSCKEYGDGYVWSAELGREGVVNYICLCGFVPCRTARRQSYAMPAYYATKIIILFRYMDIGAGNIMSDGLHAGDDIGGINLYDWFLEG